VGWPGPSHHHDQNFGEPADPMLYPRVSPSRLGSIIYRIAESTLVSVCLCTPDGPYVWATLWNWLEELELVQQVWYHAGPGLEAKWPTISRQAVGSDKQTCLQVNRSDMVVVAAAWKGGHGLVVVHGKILCSGHYNQMWITISTPVIE